MHCYVNCIRFFIESGEVRFRDGVSFSVDLEIIEVRLNQIKMREANFAHFRDWSLWKLGKLSEYLEKLYGGRFLIYLLR